MSDASWYHHREAQNHSPEHSCSPFPAGGMIFPPPSGMLDPCQSSGNNWKLISFNTTWLHHHHKKKKNTFTFSKSSSFSLFFSPSLASLYLFELFLRLPLSVCLFKINRFMYVNRKSLWIKASAKWLNVNELISKLKPATGLKKVGTGATKGWKSKRFWKDSAGRTSSNQLI